jgi:tRNA 2-thiouridine synthesizing protein A
LDQGRGDPSGRARSRTNGSETGGAAGIGFVIDRTLDIRGQVCPLTFVRSKLAIENMAPGEVLEIVVDHGPAALNVPRSLEREGHVTLGVELAGEGQWRIRVRKGPGKR